MNLLVDTQVALWLSQQDHRLTDELVEPFRDPDNTLYFSVASVWEIAIKRSLGKLTLSAPLPELIDRFRAERMRIVDVGATHALRVEHLPHVHKDPFDRLLAATCLVEGWTILSVDAVFDRYGVRRVG